MKKLLFLIAIVFVFSCKKEKESESHGQLVTFTLYSVCTPYYFSYVDKDNIDHVETITTQNYTKSFEVTPTQFNQWMGVTKMGTSFPDSIHVRADMDGKYEEFGYFIGCACSADVQIQLINLHQ